MLNYTGGTEEYPFTYQFKGVCGLSFHKCQLACSYIISTAGTKFHKVAENTEIPECSRFYGSQRQYPHSLY